MSALQIDLPDDIRHRLQAQATAEGFPTLEEYATALLRSSVDGTFVDAGTEQTLLARLDDPRPSIEFDSAFQQQFRNDVRHRRQRDGKLP